MKTKFLQLHKNHLGAFRALHLAGLILLFAGSTSLVSGTPAINRFQILIDTNQMNISEINQMNNFTYTPFAIDGVWAITQNYCGLNCPGIPPGFSQTNPDVPPSMWPNVFMKLNAAHWTISEDEANYWLEVLNNNAHVAAQSYIYPFPVRESLAYYEYFPLFPEGCSDKPWTCSSIISVEQIESEVPLFGDRIIFLARSFNGDLNSPSEAYWVREGLTAPHAGGVVFEVNPETIYGGDTNNVVDGLNDCLSRPGKNCYLLLAPNRNPTGTTENLHYADDVVNAMTYLNGQVPLNDTNLFVVLAIYGREESKVGFMTGDGNSGFNNSIWAAALALQTYRNSILPRGTLGALESVNTSSATGWAVDLETTAGYSQSIWVRLYVDGPNPGSGTLVGSTLANIPRSDVNAEGYLGNHGFSIPIPSQYVDGQPHTWYAYGISQSGIASKNSLLGTPVTVTLDVTPPSAKITAPANNAHVRGTAVTVSGWAADNGTVTRAQFQIDGTNLGPELVNPPSSFSIIWNTTLYSQTTHTLTVVVRDGANPPNITTSSPRTVTVDNTAPTGVAITSPGQGAHVGGTAVTVTATASDTNMHSVQFKRDGVDLGAPDTTPPYTVVWNTTLVPDGPHVLTAVARDIAGNPTTSIDRNVTVDNTAPTGVVMTAPAPGATVAGTVTLSANATGADLVQFQRDGVNLLPIDRTGPPYSISWNSTTVPDGLHTLRAVASDYAGNPTTSLSITVNVNNNTDD